MTQTSGDEAAARAPAQRVVRWLAYGALGGGGVLIVVAVATFLLLAHIDLARFVAARATSSLGRAVSITSLHVTPGRWLTVDVQGVSVANKSGGTRDQMARLARLTAEVEVTSLIWGPANIRRLEIDGLSVLLEHVSDDSANWRRGQAGPQPAKSAAGPDDRSWFPTLRDVHFQDSEIIDRTSSGAQIRVGLDDGRIQAATSDAPVRLDVRGAYQDIPVTLMADLQSIMAFRDAATPYGTDIHLNAGDTALRFQGTMTRPLDADGAEGTLTLHAPTIATLLVAMGVGDVVRSSLDLSGRLTRADTLWTLADAAGTLNTSAFATSVLRLTDGGRGHADSVEVDLRFDRLTVDPLLVRSRGQEGPPLTVDPEPDPRLRAKLTAREIRYLDYEASDLGLTAAIIPGRVDVDELTMLAYGGQVKATAHAMTAGAGNHVSAQASLTGVDIQRLSRGIGTGDLPLAGRLDTEMLAEATGANLPAALRAAHVSAVISMRGGTLSRDVLEAASVDLRRLFRTPKGVTSVSCLLGVVDLRAGVGTLEPLRIRTAAGTLAGQGRFDLNRRQLDLLIGSQSATTSDFALDVPFRISGSFDHPDVRPSSGKPALATLNLSGLPSMLAAAIRQNPCTTPH